MRAAKQLVTMRGPARARRGAEMADLAVISDGAVLIRNGRIEDVGLTRRVERLKTAQQAVEVDASGSVVMPAFVDSGTTPLWAKAPLKIATRTVLLQNGRTTLAGMARHGTLTAEVQSGVGGDLLGELRLLRIYDALQDGPVSLRRSFLFESSALSTVLLERIVRSRLAESVTARVSDGGQAPHEIREFLETARELRLPATVELEQGCSDQAGALALALALLGRAAALSGLETVPESAARALGLAPTVVCLAPSGAYGQRRDRFASARKLIDSGAAVALATHFHIQRNPDYNLLHTLFLACRYCGMSAAEAVTAATVNGAYATGCAQTRGTLEPGKWADLVVFDCANYESLIRDGAVNQVARVLRRGRTVYRRGKVEGLE